jgi:methylmalonyl-CoA/ethylmalonyl-CoA epimerase
VLTAFAGLVPVQVAFVVRDLERGVHDLGLDGAGPWRGFVFDADLVEGREYHGRPAEWSARVALNDRRPQFELIEPLTGPNIYEDWLETHGEGLHHLGYIVPSVSEITAQMTAAGHPTIQAGHSLGVDRDGVFAYYDTAEALGFIIEAIEMAGELPEPAFRL